LRKKRGNISRFAPAGLVNRPGIHSYPWAAFFASFLADQERRKTLLLSSIFQKTVRLSQWIPAARE